MDEGKPDHDGHICKILQMKKIFKLTALLLFAQLTTLRAQTSGSSDHQAADRGIWNLTASLNPGITFHNPRLVIGADLQVERQLTDLLGLTFSAGFTRITNKTEAVTFTFAPLIPR
ncbi:hypothetical protein SAMN06265348_109206 [Pedobacter westerhofensis]|uniref:Uncharacterized protein n=2 Tax=Pedobacter westerhofensis TaxID=425512 RepID=A0A521EXK0_9SPHI|nr:hypothetical protein SAMN06265348_109206 [Pedobacter westerhofensis]